jgi:hypothetical protein
MNENGLMPVHPDVEENHTDPAVSVVIISARPGRQPETDRPERRREMENALNKQNEEEGVNLSDRIISSGKTDKPTGNDTNCDHYHTDVSQCDR